MEGSIVNFTFRGETYSRPLTKCFPTFSQLCSFRGYVNFGRFDGGFSFDEMFAFSPVELAHPQDRIAYDQRDQESAIVRFAISQKECEAHLSLLLLVRKIAEQERNGKNTTIPSCLSHYFVNCDFGADFFVKVFEQDHVSLDQRANAFAFFARLWSKRVTSKSKVATEDMPVPELKVLQKPYTVSPKYEFFVRLYKFLASVVDSMQRKYQKSGEYVTKTKLKRSVLTSERVINLIDTHNLIEIFLEYHASQDIIEYFGSSKSAITKRVFAELMRIAFNADDNSLLVVMERETELPIIEDVSSLSSHAYELDVSLHGLLPKKLKK